MPRRICAHLYGYNAEDVTVGEGILVSSSHSSTASGFIKSIESGSKHLVIKRFTLRYPEQKLKFVGDGYQFDPKRGVGIAGY
ncbi:MAG TPA: hypothetical protein VE264_01605, partial [Nitrososphaera sp.]|nr:hypothetical protein [Nitrososphaera sp.]